MNINEINILVACEESQAIANKFRERGVRAFSCDLKDCSGGHPEHHIVGDVLPLLGGNCEFTTQDGKPHRVDGKWTMIVAHPVCTFLSSAGQKYLNVEKYGEKAIKRRQDREDAIRFFMEFVNANCDHIAIENPVGCMGSRYRPCDQTIQPWQHGDCAQKTTCLWLKGLPKIVPTNIVDKGEFVVYKSGKRCAKWYSDAFRLPPEERRTLRSKTFPGIANAITEQYLAYLLAL